MPTGRPRGNPNWQKADHKGNPGGVVAPANKTIRKALLRLLDQKPGKEFKPKSKAEEIALWLYETAQATKGTKDGVSALRELIDRADGKSAPSQEEQDAIKESGPQVIIIDPRMRPNRTQE